jgi:hypothetical protein
LSVIEIFRQLRPGTRMGAMASSLTDKVIKHWLLNTAVEFGVPLTHIFPEVSQALNVKPVPGCGSEGYASGLVELFDSGMIALSSEVEGDDTRSRTGVLQILERFRMLQMTTRPYVAMVAL